MLLRSRASAFVITFTFQCVCSYVHVLMRLLLLSRVSQFVISFSCQCVCYNVQVLVRLLLLSRVSAFVITFTCQCVCSNVHVLVRLLLLSRVSQFVITFTCQCVCYYVHVLVRSLLRSRVSEFVLTFTCKYLCSYVHALVHFYNMHVLVRFVRLSFVSFISLYCMRTLTRYYRINYMDHCIAKQVLHVYTMDTGVILCCNYMTINLPISKFSIPCNEFMRVSYCVMFICVICHVTRAIRPIELVFIINTYPYSYVYIFQFDGSFYTFFLRTFGANPETLARGTDKEFAINVSLTAGVVQNLPGSTT